MPDFEPYIDCNTYPKCFSGRCRQCPSYVAELAEFYRRTEGRVSEMAAEIWHPKTKPLVGLAGGSQSRSSRDKPVARARGGCFAESSARNIQGSGKSSSRTWRPCYSSGASLLLKKSQSRRKLDMRLAQVTNDASAPSSPHLKG